MMRKIIALMLTVMFMFAACDEQLAVDNGQLTIEPEIPTQEEPEEIEEPEMLATDWQESPVSDFEYEYDEELGGMVIRKYKGSDTHVTIPARIDGEPVVGIFGAWMGDGFDSAFGFNNKINSVLIPEGVTYIGDFAFFLCENLTSVYFPESLTYIGHSAFRVTGLTSVTISENVEYIGNNAFSLCRDLPQIIVDEKNAVYTSVDGVLFNKEMTELLQYPAGKNGTHYVIPDGITSINNEAFFDAALESVVIPESVITLDYRAFASTNLREVIIPDSIINIGGSAFENCNDLTSIIIGNNVENIGDYAFRGTAITKIIIPDSVKTIGEWAFMHCEELVSVTIGNSLINIGEGAFYGCRNLTNLEIAFWDGTFIYDEEIKDLPEEFYNAVNGV